MIAAKVDLATVLKLVDRMRSAIPPTTGSVEAEYAALLFYCNVAEGVGKFPQHRRMQRAVLIADTGAKAMAMAINAVGQLSDAQVDAALARLRS